MSTIDSIVSTGLSKVGYVYVNLDDCWAGSRLPNGSVVPDPKSFPNGIKPLADYAHSKNLKFGVYSDAGNKTCAGMYVHIYHIYAICNHILNE